MNQIDAAISQYSITINQLSARLAQAAAELAAALEQIESLTKVNKAQEDVIEAYKKSADVGKDVLDLIAGKPKLEAVPKDDAA